MPKCADLTSKKLIIFRVDSATQIGTGHLMRCLTLATALREEGATCLFISRAHPNNIIPLIKQKGFTVHELPAGTEPLTPADLGVSSELDAKQTKQIIEDLGATPDWLVVDHYGIDKAWEQQLRPVVKQIFVIDDLANRPHDCDVLLDQNDYHKKNSYNSLVPDYTSLLVGSAYSILRREFIISERRLRPLNKIRKIFIYFGGSDPYKLTLRAVQCLLEIKIKSPKIYIVLSENSSSFQELKNMIHMKSNYKLYGFCDNIHELISKADLGVGAGGTNAKERIALGLPSIVISLGIDQHQFCKHLHKSKRIFYLGNYKDVNYQKMKESLLFFINNPEQARCISKNCLESNIADGTQKICRLLMDVN